MDRFTSRAAEGAVSTLLSVVLHVFSDFLAGLKPVFFSAATGCSLLTLNLYVVVFLLEYLLFLLSVYGDNIA